MQQHIANMALVVRDYDEAIAFYVNKLHFRLIEDTILNEVKRWVRVAPPGDSETCLLLAKAKNERELKAVGYQSGGRVFLFLFTDDFERDFENLLQHEVEIIRPPADFDYGRVCVFADLYGNLWDLIEPNN